MKNLLVRIEMEETRRKVKAGLEYTSHISKTVDVIPKCNIELEGGNVYGINCECGEGGDLLSYILSGKYIGKGQKVYIDNQIIGIRDLKKISFYVGQGISNSILGRRKTVLQQLELGYKESRMDIHDVMNRFGLDKYRVSFKLSCLSGQRWRASLAIGYINGRKIFCFPWLKRDFLNRIVDSGIHICIDILKKAGCIVIIPSANKEILDLLVDKYIVLNNEYYEIHVDQAKANILSYRQRPEKE